MLVEILPETSNSYAEIRVASDPDRTVPDTVPAGQLVRFRERPASGAGGTEDLAHATHSSRARVHPSRQRGGSVIVRIATAVNSCSVYARAQKYGPTGLVWRRLSPRWRTAVGRRAAGVG